MCANPQKENGYTAIANEILEATIRTGLNGTELAILLLLWRKTYGWNKKEDEISLNQFLQAIPVSKATVCSALKNLQLVKIIILVKKGTSKKHSNLWVFNKNYEEWQLVKKSKLVKFSKPTSPVFKTQLVKKTGHTKDNYKRNKTKEIIQQLVKKSKLVKFSKPTSPVFKTQLVKKTGHTKDNYKRNKTKEIIQQPVSIEDTPPSQVGHSLKLESESESELELESEGDCFMEKKLTPYENSIYQELLEFKGKAEDKLWIWDNYHVKDIDEAMDKAFKQTKKDYFEIGVGYVKKILGDYDKK